MELDLSPKSAQVVFEGDAGSYEVWASSELAETKVGAGKLLLHPCGFALPHYADSSKIGFVLQGTKGQVGMVFPNSSKEIVLNLKKGDVIPVPLGSTSWWFNNGDINSNDDDLSIVFLGETSKAYVPGQFTYFFLSGTLGNLGGFSSKFISKAYNLNQDETNKISTSQTGSLAIKLDSSISMPKSECDHDVVEKFVYSVEGAEADLKVENGGVIKIVSEDKFPFIGEVGLSVRHVKLDKNAMYSPSYNANGDATLFYVVEGSGEVEIVGLNGKQALDSKLEGGKLFLVPRFLSFALIAGDDGLEFISISTSTRPVIEELATKKSVWNALSPIVSQVALNVTPQLEKLFKSNMINSIIIPPK